MEKILMGVGNELKGDDGVGNRLAREFDNEDWLSVPCETVPENFGGLVKKKEPDILVLVDAARMDLPPGEIRRLSKEELSSEGIGTHSMPLNLLLLQLEEYVGEVVVLGIQPKEVKVEEKLSTEAREAVEELKTVLKEGKWDEIEMKN